MHTVAQFVAVTSWPTSELLADPVTHRTVKELLTEVRGQAVRLAVPDPAQ